MKRLWFAIAVSSIFLSGILTVQAAPLIAYYATNSDVRDYSDSGLNLGNNGFWFANFAATTPATLAPVNQNHRNFLPDWIQVDFDPDSPNYSFSKPLSPATIPIATSTGGQSDYNVLTLPNGESGLSGQLVDVGVDPDLEGSQSDTIINHFVFGPGTPNSFLLHVVLDNDSSDSGNHVERLRVRHFSADSNQDPFAQVFVSDLTGVYNSIADVYSFRLDDTQLGGYFAIQLRTAGDKSSPNTGMAGVMFDVIPVPPSLWLVGLGIVSMGWIMTRRSRVVRIC